MSDTGRFSRDEFLRLDAAAQRERCAELGCLLTAELQPSDFHASCLRIVAVMRTIGHDLWSFDEDDEFEIWCPNYAAGGDAGLVLTLRPTNAVVEWRRERTV